MMVSTEVKMDDEREKSESGLRNPLWIIVAAFFIVLAAGAIVGFVGAHTKGGGPVSSVDIAVIATLFVIIVALGIVIARLARGMATRGGPLTRREKLNQKIMIACMVSGAVIGVILASSGNGASASQSLDHIIFSDTPLPLAIALPLTLFWGLGMPLIAWFWHARAIDEQEAAAYRDGAYYAAYVYLIAAPLWWLLWRGGLLPEPNGIAIFFSFSVIWSSVWFWKKYH